MNGRIETAMPASVSEDTAQISYISDLRGFVCHVPSIIVGQPMTIMFSNAVSVRYNAKTVISCSDDGAGLYHIETDDAVLQIRDLEYGAKKHKRIRATRYMESRIRHNPLRAEHDPDGHLFADGEYPTKIFASDLPEHFVYGYMYKRHGFISAAGVRHLLYVPNYVFNHRHKDDTLYISYESPIWAETDAYGTHYVGYKHAVSGWLIIDFINAAEKYSGYDVSQIRREIQEKSDWFDEKYGKDGMNG